MYKFWQRVVQAVGLYKLHRVTYSNISIRMQYKVTSRTIQIPI